jgi:hypothetical protein
MFDMARVVDLSPLSACAADGMSAITITVATTANQLILVRIWLPFPGSAT